MSEIPSARKGGVYRTVTASRQVKPREIAEAVHSYLQKHGVFALEDPALRKALDLLRRTEAEASGAADRYRAKQNLEYALDGFHLEKPLQKGRPRKTPDEDVSLDYQKTIQDLRLLDAPRRNNLDSLTTEIAHQFRIPKEVAGKVTTLIRRSRPQHAEAAKLILARRYSASPRSLERSLVQGRDYQGLWLLGCNKRITDARNACWELQRQRRESSSGEPVSKALACVRPDLLSAWDGLDVARLLAHQIALSHPDAWEYFLHHAHELGIVTAIGEALWHHSHHDEGFCDIYKSPPKEWDPRLPSRVEKSASLPRSTTSEIRKTPR